MAYKPKKKREACPYCNGGGICASLADAGYRRTVHSDADSDRVWASSRRYQCEVCNSPGEFPKNPKPFIKQ